MRRISKAFSLLILVVVLMVSSIGCDSNTAEQGGGNISKIATNQPGQNWMTLGSALSEYLKGTIDLSVEPGSTYGNVITTNNGETQYGITAATSISSAMQGVRYFEKYGKQENVRFVASLYRHYLRSITVKDDINTYADIKGKSVTFGPPGGESFDYGPLILSYYGLQEGDYTVKTMPFGDAAEAMKNGQLDVIMNCSPFPFALFDDITQSSGGKAHLISLSEDMAKRLASEWPGFEYTVYDLPDPIKFEKPFYSPFQQITIIANKDVTEDEIYKFTKCLYDNFEKLSGVVINLEQIGGKENLVYNPAKIPLHPGAEKFYQETGLLK
ncbi:MAG: TAXI family TRAP transporter solute-binding subunit [Peptococcaceae bacterium]